MEERLQKILSAAGICSRRASEAYLTAGRVTVNGEAAQLGQAGGPGNRCDMRGRRAGQDHSEADLRHAE